MNNLASPILTGNFHVIPLLDGMFPIGLDLIPQADCETGKQLLEAAGKPASGPSLEPVNAYLVSQEGRHFLIDSGCGSVFGPNLGGIAEALRATGVDTSSIEVIVLTHMHPDHIGGLLTPNGRPRFERAEIIVQQAEVDYWDDLVQQANAPAFTAPWFELARAVLLAYTGRVRFLNGDEEVFPGVRAVPLAGHTPGHMGILFHHGDQPLLVWGDIVHCATLQLAQPDWAVQFDVDPGQASATRLNLLDELVVDQTRVCGMHLDGVGRVERWNGGYRICADSQL